MRILSVEPGSAAEKLGLRAGEDLAAINGAPIRDLLDYHFHAADGDLLLQLRDNGGPPRQVAVQLAPGEDLGLAFDELKMRLCGNECVFCFIDQNPRGMRQTLYVKDEDYRLSFLHGNFVTLTNIKKWELERIVEQRLSPLYISVHSTDPRTRQRLLRPKVDKDILQLIDYLGRSGIVMHTQVVLCPTYNDGDDLDHTIEDLAARRPWVESLAIVPLGMTEHRAGLERLPPFGVGEAESLRRQVEPYQRRFRRESGRSFVHLADEVYRLLGAPVPAGRHYDGFPQIENGIGLTRHFLDRLRRARRLFPDLPRGRAGACTVVTGEMFEPILREAIAGALARTGERMEVRTVGCRNLTFGPTVTVAGLLTGRCIESALEGRLFGDRVYLPPATLDREGRFLDDRTREEMVERFGVAFHGGFFGR